VSVLDWLNEKRARDLTSRTLLVLGGRLELPTPRVSVECYYQLSYPSRLIADPKVNIASLAEASDGES
jgi:hypothetical protein